jgi:uroporphyrinogen-III synthase
LLNYWVFRDARSLNILLTRALAQVQPLQTLVSQSGYQAILFPSLKVEPLSNAPLKSHYDVLIFISSNAVEYSLEILKNLAHQQCRFFAVGAATANKLNEYGFEVDAFPGEKASSEALLALSEVKMLTDKDILIFRGKGGRETLREGLERHNTVEYIVAYQRVVCDATY